MCFCVWVLKFLHIYYVFWFVLCFLCIFYLVSCVFSSVLASIVASIVAKIEWWEAIIGWFIVCPTYLVSVVLVKGTLFRKYIKFLKYYHAREIIQRQFDSQKEEKRSSSQLQRAQDIEKADQSPSPSPQPHRPHVPTTPTKKRHKSYKLKSKPTLKIHIEQHSLQLERPALLADRSNSQLRNSGDLSLDDEIITVVSGKHKIAMATSSSKIGKIDHSESDIVPSVQYILDDSTDFNDLTFDFDNIASDTKKAQQILDAKKRLFDEMDTIDELAVGIDAENENKTKVKSNRKNKMIDRNDTNEQRDSVNFAYGLALATSDLRGKLLRNDGANSYVNKAITRTVDICCWKQVISMDKWWNIQSLLNALPFWLFFGFFIVSGLYRVGTIISGFMFVFVCCAWNPYYYSGHREKQFEKMAKNDKLRVFCGICGYCCRCEKYTQNIHNNDDHDNNSDEQVVDASSNDIIWCNGCCVNELTQLRDYFNYTPVAFGYTVYSIVGIVNIGISIIVSFFGISFWIAQDFGDSTDLATFAEFMLIHMAVVASCYFVPSLGMSVCSVLSCFFCFFAETETMKNVM